MQQSVELEGKPEDGARSIGSADRGGTAPRLSAGNVMLLLYRALVIVACLFLLAPAPLHGGATFGLDPSYQIGLLHALEHGLVFGTEYVFPYGPLAALMTRLAPAGWDWWLVSSDIALFAAVSTTVVLIACELRTYAALSLLLLGMMVMAPGVYLYSSVIVWFGLMGGCLAWHFRSGSLAALAFAGFISLLVLYLKLNFGLVTVPLMLATLGALCVLGPRRGAAGVASVLYLVALFASAAALRVDLVPYLRSGWHLADSFNDAMALPPDSFGFESHLWMAVVVTTAFAALVIANLRAILRDRATLVHAAFTSLLLFLLFKQSFVRADGHALIFHQFAAWAIALFTLTATGEVKRSARGCLCLAVLFSFATARDQFTEPFLDERIDAWQRYSSSFSPAPLPPPTVPEIARLPESLLRTIGDASVDIIPWEVSFAYFNKLNYDPRPIFQTYQAYDEYLDSLNADFFRSARAPSFILLSDYCVDGRYCFADESKTKLAILERYAVRQREGAFLLLEKRSEALPVRLEPVLTGRARVGQWIKLPASATPLVVRVNVSYSLRGKLQRTVYQPRPLRLRLHLANGGTRMYRAVLPILRGGFVATPFVPDLAAFESFFAGRFAELHRVDRISIDAMDRWAFEPSVSYTIERLQGLDSPPTGGAEPPPSPALQLPRP